MPVKWCLHPAQRSAWKRWVRGSLSGNKFKKRTHEIVACKHVVKREYHKVLSSRGEIETLS
jgi:hypothetical protein